MADETYAENMLRWVCANIQLQTTLLVGQQMFGKSYFALGVGERAAADRAAFEATVLNYKATTLENLVALSNPMETKPETGPMGFVSHPAQPEKTESTPPRTSKVKA